MGTMKVGFVVATKYPDMIEVKARLAKGLETEHETYIRKGDTLLRRLHKELEKEPLEFESSMDLPRGSEGYLCEFLGAMDYVIVYHANGSTVTSYFHKKATEWPYDLIFGDKLSVIDKTTKLKKTRKQGKPGRAEG